MPEDNNLTAPTKNEGDKEFNFEYLCTHSNCQNPAVEVVGVVPELGVAVALCRTHADEKAGRR